MPRGRRAAARFFFFGAAALFFFEGAGFARLAFARRGAVARRAGFRRAARFFAGLRRDDAAFLRRAGALFFGFDLAMEKLYISMG